jgi:SAM-dependent methyltransferase
VPALKALLAQLIAGAALFGGLRWGMLPPGQPLFAWALIQGMLAAGIATLQRSARWWLVIHLSFAPLVVMATRWQITPVWYLAAFLLLLAIYGRSYRTQVPLYLSNRVTVAAVVRLIPDGARWQVLDLGSGTGSLLRPLARLRPNARLTGIEAAPGPFWLSRLLGRSSPNLAFRHGSFWACPWGGYDLIYAFLSPVPMAEVWRKASREMKPGAWLVSNTFPVPDVEPAFVLELEDRRRTRLYGYQPGGNGRRKGRKSAANHP